jgi:hypothetical protein
MVQSSVNYDHLNFLDIHGKVPQFRLNYVFSGRSPPYLTEYFLLDLVIVVIILSQYQMQILL